MNFIIAILAITTIVLSYTTINIIDTNGSTLELGAVYTACCISGIATILVALKTYPIATIKDKQEL